jgi:hypothetical protein
VYERDFHTEALVIAFLILFSLVAFAWLSPIFAVQISLTQRIAQALASLPLIP